MQIEEMSSESHLVCMRADKTIKLARAAIDDLQDACATTRAYLEEIKAKSRFKIPIDWETFKI